MKYSFKNNWFMLKLIWQYSPLFIICEIIGGILGGINSSANVIFVKIFYDCIEKNTPFSTAAMVVGIMIAYFIAFNAYSKWYTFVFAQIQKEKIQKGMQTFLFAKARELDLELYDNPEFYDDFIWSMSECDTRAVGLIDSIASFIKYILGIWITISVMASVSIELAIVAIICTIISIITSRVEMKITYQKDTKLNSLNRKSEYLERIFSTPDYAKEVRLSHMAELNEEEYMKNLDNIRKTNVFFNKKLLCCELISTFMSTAIEPLIYIMLIYMAMYINSMSITGIAIAFSAFWSLWSNLEDIIELIITFPKYGMYIERVRTFLDYVPKIKYGKHFAPPFQSITLKDVTFGYKEHEPVLKNINFNIKRGEKIAIVGYNGAGKSTFIKLLLHLYEPQNGKILYNNQDISEYTRESYRSRIGVVLQDFKIFAATIAENVLCDKYTKDQSSKILSALKKATFLNKLETLEKGIKSELTREFSDEGIQLSGGEAQKLAISRVFAGNYDLLILDEPSSALDPMAESELSRSILEASEDKTVIFISHRLSTTRGADRIYMFEEGRIIEAGTHKELINVNGKYAEMFNVQAKKYLVN